MSYEIKRIESTICMLEDNLLRSRNQYEIERLQMDLYRLRRKLQTLKQRESLRLFLLFFAKVAYSFMKENKGGYLYEN